MSVAPAPSLSLEECSFSLNCKSDRSFPHVNKHITIKAHHPRYGRVGVLYACRIDKSTCSVRGDFHLIMDESELGELSEFAFWLFDKRGQLKPEFTANGYQRGTGAFGQELNDAILLYVPSVIVEPEVIRNSLCVWLKLNSPSWLTVQKERCSFSPSLGARVLPIWYGGGQHHR